MIVKTAATVALAAALLSSSQVSAADPLPPQKYVIPSSILGPGVVVHRDVEVRNKYYNDRAPILDDLYDTFSGKYLNTSQTPTAVYDVARFYKVLPKDNAARLVKFVLSFTISNGKVVYINVPSLVTVNGITSGAVVRSNRHICDAQAGANVGHILVSATVWEKTNQCSLAIRQARAIVKYLLSKV